MADFEVCPDIRKAFFLNWEKASCYYSVNRYPNHQK